jgi:phage/plasmid-associated DNA primase
MKNKDITVKFEDFDNNDMHLNFKDYLFNLKDRKLEPHNPSILFTSKNNSNHNPNIDISDANLNWNKFVTQIEPDKEQRRLLQKSMGYSCCCSSLKERKAFIIKGPTGTGKSTFME